MTAGSAAPHAGSYRAPEALHAAPSRAAPQAPCASAADLPSGAPSPPPFELQEREHRTDRQEPDPDDARLRRPLPVVSAPGLRDQRAPHDRRRAGHHGRDNVREERTLRHGFYVCLAIATVSTEPAQRPPAIAATQPHSVVPRALASFSTVSIPFVSFSLGGGIFPVSWKIDSR